MKRLSLVVTIAFALLGSSSYAAGSSITGTLCKKSGSTKTLTGYKYLCIKSGKKLVWSRGKLVRAKMPPHLPASSSTPTPTPTPTFVPPDVPHGFDDLVTKRDGISWAAWTAISKTINATSPRSPQLELFTGPSTNPWFDDYPRVLDLVSKAFPNYRIPSKVTVLRYSFADLQWAEDRMKELVSADEYNNLQRNEQDHLVDSNCQTASKDCNGAKQVSTLNQHFILQGIRKSPEWRELYGHLEAHEYFHALQRETTRGTPNSYSSWRYRWLIEGGAEWVQNGTVNFNSYDKYIETLRKDCDGPCRKIRESEITEFLLLGPEADGRYDRFLAYSLGSRVIEVLVALKGQEIVLKLITDMHWGSSFESAFAENFGVEWSAAVPQIAKAISANIADGK